MRLISFKYTKRQFRDRSKRVTRRLGWDTLKPGTRLMGVEQAQGLGKGGKVKELGEIVVLSVRRERLGAITKEDCVLEGFPDLEPAEFVAMFCKHMGCKPSTFVTRIEFDYIYVVDKKGKPRAKAIRPHQKAQRSAPLHSQGTLF